MLLKQFTISAERKAEVRENRPVPLPFLFRSYKVFATILVFMTVFRWSTVANADEIQTAGNILQVALPIAGLVTTLGLEDNEGTYSGLKVLDQP